ncbi:MAG: shikimate kinase, partial [Spirochaetales bacterium]|nr:shikimate kinase [Spirochaetales bacterium]
AGKSTLGVVLAKTVGYSFIDTDVLIQDSKKKLLQEILSTEGIDSFLRAEERTILDFQCVRCVIATGGSAVLSGKAMAHLKKIGTVVYLQLDLDTLSSRIMNIETRGIVMEKGQSLHDIYTVRAPLYEKYADVTVDCRNRDFEEIINELVRKTGNPND